MKNLNRLNTGKMIYAFLWIFTLHFVIMTTAFPAETVSEKLYDPQGARDPFVPLLSSGGQGGSGLLAVESIEDLIIEGIVYDPPDGSIVIVNGTVMAPGNEVGSVKLLEIDEQGALFSVNGIEGRKLMYADEI